MKRAAAFFAYARKRQQILLDRRSGKPAPWTDDRVLRRYPFCNVFREDDRTTRWFREHVREPLQDRPEVLLATVVFRMFNRIETGEAIFCDDDLIDESSAFFEFAKTGKTTTMKRAIVSRIGMKGPYVTGSYIISTPTGYSKLDGVLEILRRFWKDQREWEGLGAGIMDTMGWGGEEGAAVILECNDMSLEDTWKWLGKFDYLGRFHAYEIVTDLRHTALLERAPDKDTWANPGPGARRGLNRVLGRHYKDKRLTRAEQIALMRELLVSSRDATMWPSALSKKLLEDWPRWELRDVEHTLCEFDKYERMRLGQGRSKRLFRGGGA